MGTLSAIVLRIYLWLLATVIGSRLAMWGLGRDRWAKRGDAEEWAIRLAVGCCAARWMGWL